MLNRFRVLKLSAISCFIKTNQGKSNPFLILSSTIHTSNQPTIKLSDLRYAFDCIENIDEAVALFHYMFEMKPFPSVRDYNMLFNVIVKMQHYARVIDMFKEYSILGCRVDEYSMNTVINCYANLKEVELGFAIVADFLKRGYSPTIVTFNCLIKGFFYKGDVVKAIGLFKKALRERLREVEVDEFTIPIVLQGLSDSGNLGDALELLQICEKKDWKVNVVGYNSLMDGLFKARMLKDGMALLFRMIQRDVLPNVVTYNTLIHAFWSNDLLSFALGIFSELPSKGICPNVITYTVMIQGLCKVGLFSEAEKMLELMERDGCSPDSVTCNVVIQGCMHHHNSIHSINLLKQIVKRDFLLDASSFFVLLGRMQVLRQMPGVYDDDVINLLIQKLIVSCPTHQMRDNKDEFNFSSSIQKFTSMMN